MASCEATSLVTKLWMKRAFSARKFVHRLGRLMTARSKLHFHLLSSLGFRQSASWRAFSAVASSAGKKHSILICCSAASVGIASVVKVEKKARRKSPLASCIVMTGDDGRIARQPPFGRQPGIGHDFVEQLRRSPAALRDVAMKDLDHLAGELVPVHDELPQPLGMENDVHGVVGNAGFHLVQNRETASAGAPSPGCACERPSARR